jgi:precorrin isomerase
VSVRVVPSVLAVLAATSLAAGACGPEPTEPAAAAPVLRVAILQNGGVADPVELVSSSALSVDLAIQRAEARGELAPDSGLSFVETAGEDPAAVERTARALAADPSVVAAVVTPFVNAPGAERAFGEAGIPVFSFSGLGGDGASTTWRRLVPTASDVAGTLGALAGEDACVAGWSAGAPSPDGIDIGTDLDEITTRAADERCSGVVWLGDADGALAVVMALDGAGTDVPVIVGAPARVERLASEGYPEAVGTVGVVPCRSVAVSAEPDARRFVHAYQAGHGVPPGLCAAEAYGLGSWLVDRGSRAAIASALAGGDTVPTPAGPIDLSAGASVSPAIERVVGVRWIPTAAP